VQLHKALSRGRRITQQQASDELGVSVRHVRDLVAGLREGGIPIQESFEDRERIYYLEPNDWHADNITLDLPERELLTLLVATQAARPVLAPTPLAEDLESASAALEETLGGQGRVVHPCLRVGALALQPCHVSGHRAGRVLGPQARYR
jgi:predicted DNA-binding transcriptional regulator YafY